MAFVVVVSERYTELGRALTVEGAREAGRLVVRELQALGLEARLLHGKATERRIERAVRSAGKAARRGERAGVVLLGLSLGGGFAPENFAPRRPGKALRNFPGPRLDRLYGGFGGVEVFEPGFDGGFTGPDGGFGEWWKRFDNRWWPSTPPRFDFEELKKRVRWRFGRPQVDPGSDGFWSTSGGTWSVGGTATGLNVLEIFSPNGATVLGLLVMQADGNGSFEETWHFQAGSWPTGGFSIRRLDGDPSNGAGRWANLSLATAAGWPAYPTYTWSGFAANAQSVQMPPAWRLRRALSTGPDVFAVPGPGAITWYGSTRSPVSVGLANRIDVTPVPAATRTVYPAA